ncbi:MAG: protein-glutamate O-methyltransferase CheR [Phycisphaeraceae bacterium]|nr:protein-glutamate O-methyltransferase CheR [Phycisphaeraceae bacterium]
MTAAQFDALRGLIYDRSGIHYPESRRPALESRLSRRLRDLGIPDYDRYIRSLLSPETRDIEFRELINHITVNETSFLRNPPQLEVFEHHLLPDLIRRRRPHRQLRIWSAACSTGQEPYTLAMQVHRTIGREIADWNIHILGTDISEKALAAAWLGRYAREAVRTLPPAMLEAYFIEHGDDVRVVPAIRNMVQFKTLNLKDAARVMCMEIFDVIFCRNVMIYFDDEMKERCAALLAARLADDGAMFIGHSESLRNLKVPLEAMGLPHAFAYRKVTGLGHAA